MRQRRSMPELVLARSTLVTPSTNTITAESGAPPNLFFDVAVFAIIEPRRSGIVGVLVLHGFFATVNPLGDLFFLADRGDQAALVIVQRERRRARRLEARSLRRGLRDLRCERGIAPRITMRRTFRRFLRFRFLRGRFFRGRVFL